MLHYGLHLSVFKLKLTFKNNDSCREDTEMNGNGITRNVLFRLKLEFIRVYNVLVI